MRASLGKLTLLIGFAVPTVASAQDAHQAPIKEPAASADQTAVPTDLAACETLEADFQFGRATQCYERLSRTLAATEDGREALWRYARMEYRFLKLNAALRAFDKIATDPDFKNYAHRDDSRLIAAAIRGQRPKPKAPHPPRYLPDPDHRVFAVDGETQDPHTSRQDGSRPTRALRPTARNL